MTSLTNEDWIEREVLLVKAVARDLKAERLRTCADIHAELALVARAEGGRGYHEARADRLIQLSYEADQEATHFLESAARVEAEPGA